MTVVAAFSIDFVPIVLGDLLLTGMTSGDNPRVVLPALGDVQDFWGPGFAVLRLSQKVVIVAPNCIVAWAGSWLNARVAIAGLRALASQAPLTRAAIGEYLTSEPDLKDGNTAFVGMVHEPSGIKQFHCNAELCYESPLLQRVMSSGTGAQALRKVAGLLDRFDAPSTEVEPFALAQAHALSICGYLLGSEFHGSGASTIGNAFGGGYEIAGFLGRNNEAIKLSELTYVLWDAQYDGQSEWQPELIVKQQYFGDVLALRSLRKMDRSDPGSIYEEHNGIILPMYEGSTRPTKDQLAHMQFASPVFCHLVRIRRGSSVVGTTVLVRWYESVEQSELQFTRAEGMVFVWRKGDLLIDLRDLVRRFPLQQ